MSLAVLESSSPGPAADAPTDAARIGPNAVLQTLRAARELEGASFECDLLETTGLRRESCRAMIPETWFVDLVTALRALRPHDRSEAILSRAGELTGQYVAENRIPPPFRWVLGALPARLALPLLLLAFSRHAWTFAGRGGFSTEGPYPGVIRLTDSPTCRTTNAAEPAGAYYAAAFERLLQLAAPGVRVREIECAALGFPACRFEIRPPSSLLGEPSCASS